MQSRLLLFALLVSGGHLASLPLFASAQSWQSLPDIPSSIGEVAAGIINGVLYVVGQFDSGTYTYDFARGSWSTAATRPYIGDHHGLVLPQDGRLWLVGGFSGGSEGKVLLLPNLCVSLVFLSTLCFLPCLFLVRLGIVFGFCSQVRGSVYLGLCKTLPSRVLRRSFLYLFHISSHSFSFFHALS